MPTAGSPLDGSAFWLQPIGRGAVSSRPAVSDLVPITNDAGHGFMNSNARIMVLQTDTRIYVAKTSEPRGDYPDSARLPVARSYPKFSRNTVASAQLEKQTR